VAEGSGLLNRRTGSTRTVSSNLIPSASSSLVILRILVHRNSVGVDKWRANAVIRVVQTAGGKFGISSALDLCFGPIVTRRMFIVPMSGFVLVGDLGLVARYRL
jgi:hypothetical protein